uniref:UPAR/Ly6 domain-containing protein n=1 Tax=Panagrellus redivivus TaxID=6233 RepID=A0A7E4W799_PANRE
MIRCGVLILTFCFVIANASQCYNDDLVPIYCSATSQFCLKADAYNGQTYRGCAYMNDCPQGQSCAPITYSSDGTTDYVCCCVGDFCNSSGFVMPQVTSLLTVVASCIYLYYC